MPRKNLKRTSLNNIIEDKRKMAERALDLALGDGVSKDEIESLKKNAEPKSLKEETDVSSGNIGKKKGSVRHPEVVKKTAVAPLDEIKVTGRKRVGEIKDAETTRVIKNESVDKVKKRMEEGGKELREFKKHTKLVNPDREVNAAALAALAKKATSGSVDDAEEVFQLTRNELAELLNNPLGALVGGNDKDADFVLAYQKCGNVIEALRMCEYTSDVILENDAAMIALAHNIMRREDIRSAIAWCRKRQLDDLIVSRDEYADYLSQIVRGNVGDMLDDDGMIQPSKVKQHGRVISSYSCSIGRGGDIKTSIKMKDPIVAAKELQKIQKMLTTDRQGSNAALDDDYLKSIDDDAIDVEVIEAELVEDKANDEKSETETSE